MNRLERAVDEVDPGLSVRMRALKMRLRHDIFPRLLQDMMGPAEVGVDVGANRGVYAYLMSLRVGPQGHVHALEPFPGNGERLRTIARRRGNITVHMVAASDRPGVGLLRIPVHDGRRIDWEAGDALVVENACVSSTGFACVRFFGGTYQPR